MSLIDEVEAVPRKTMVLFYIIDTSGSMNGEKIGIVNTAIDELVPEIKDISSSNADAQIKIAALQFDSGCRWITSSGPIEVENFHWNHVNAQGVTDFGAACKELDKKLSTKEFLNEASGAFAPAIILFSDGEPTDDWEPELDKLKNNNWFKAAIKVSLAVGHDASHDVLEQFTGTPEAVLEANNGTMLKKMIKFVSVRASKVASKSTQAGSETKTKQEQLNDELKEIAEEAATDNSDDEW
ncbi:MAG: VWA domain-containing protein [Termitinemataceae bacterium]|nr:MAG: VWA domain-containing protein [Termitinemataceae bacterium]